MRRNGAIMLLLASAGAALAQDALAPPSGPQKWFEFRADGVQIYVCKLKDEAQKTQSFAWVFAAPEAVLFDAQGK